jgi:hypothetical protein
MALLVVLRDPKETPSTKGAALAALERFVLSEAEHADFISTHQAVEGLIPPIAPL